MEKQMTSRYRWQWCYDTHSGLLMSQNLKGGKKKLNIV